MSWYKKLLIKHSENTMKAIEEAKKTAPEGTESVFIFNGEQGDLLYMNGKWYVLLSKYTALPLNTDFV